MNATTSERLALDVRGVAAMLGVSARHVWSMVSSGRLPAPVQLGKRRIWQRAAIEAWLAQEHERAQRGETR